VIKKTPWYLAAKSSRVPEHVDEMERRFQTLKADIHQELVESLDLSRVGQSDGEGLLPQARAIAQRMCRSRGDALGKMDRERLLDELMSELFGLGPLDRLMEDPEVTDILVNDPYTVYIERRGRLELTNVMFADTEHLMRIIRRVVSQIGRRIDEVCPLVDARLPDGSRVNAVIPPLAVDGPSLSIRRFGTSPLRLEDLLTNRSLLATMADFLRAAVISRVGFLISGGTGAGKTTLLNALSASIPADERIVTIEDSAELILQHRHRVRMETRPPNSEGAGEYTQRDLVKNSLRMRPDRIVVGEVRGAEVWDMLQAMNTGHEGSLTTIHANSATDALSRLEMMIAMTGFDLPIGVVRQYVASALHLIVHVARLKGGPRRLMSISEIVGVRDGHYVVEDIFGFRQTGITADGMARGVFHATGYRPACLERFTAGGIDLPPEMFQQRELEVA
jgi:pilus assembly protein CpaF